MARPLKWAHDVHLIRERVQRSHIETWSRTDIQHLFGIGRASAQSLIKTIGQVGVVGGAHFVERVALLNFLEEMLQAPELAPAVRQRAAGAEPPPRPKSLRISLPESLRRSMLSDLPDNVQLTPGRLVIEAESTVELLKSLVTLAMIMQNDLDRFQQLVEPARERETRFAE